MKKNIRKPILLGLSTILTCTLLLTACATPTPGSETTMTPSPSPSTEATMTPSPSPSIEPGTTEVMPADVEKVFYLNNDQALSLTLNSDKTYVDNLDKAEEGTWSISDGIYILSSTTSGNAYRMSVSEDGATAILSKGDNDYELTSMVKS